MKTESRTLFTNSVLLTSQSDSINLVHNVASKDGSSTTSFKVAPGKILITMHSEQIVPILYM